jgi:Ni2+-binding GTPase involved in maturation of urease and hydrogenase
MNNNEITINVSSKVGSGKSNIIAIIKKALIDNGIDDIKIISYDPIPIITEDIKEKMKNKKIIIKGIQYSRV